MSTAEQRLTPLASRLPSLARLESLDLRGMKLGLEAIDAVCERLGRPETRVPSVLVAGTNGKGSTAAMLASIAGASGSRAGLYTSPHLIAVTERIRIGSEDVSPEELDGALESVFAAADRAPQVKLTYFEAMTAAAFRVFAGQALDLAVLEVGLGGRLDATNVAPARMSIVTSIGLDHMEDLGPTLDAIAREKAGVFRPGRPALVGVDTEEARAALEESARSAGARFHDIDREARVDSLETGLEGTRFRVQTPVRRYELATPLPGAHQARNAALAVRAAELLAGDPPIDAAAIAAGVASVRWPGRLERFHAGGRTVLLDGCHNPEGARALAGFLAHAGLRGDLIFGVMADKPVEEIGRLLLPRMASVCFTAPATMRACRPEELARRLEPEAPAASIAPTVERALSVALAQRRTEPIIVAGSLYLVGEARALLLSGRFA